MRKYFSTYTVNTNDLEPLVHLWILRILVSLGGHREFLHSRSFIDDGLAAAIGLEHWINPSPNDFDPRTVLTELRQLHQNAERQWANALPPACLRSNVERLSKLAGLNATDCRILEFAVMIRIERILDDAADLLKQLPTHKMFRTLSVILDLPESEIRASLSKRGILARSGLVTVDGNINAKLGGKLQLLTFTFAEPMATEECDPVMLLRDIVTVVAPAQLSLAEYSHIQSALDIILPYLRNATATGQRGVNIFIHGAPGTGKSQLTRTLAEHLGCELFEVSSEDADGDPVDGENRLRAYRAAQSFFGQRQALIVFDEVEDVFNDGDRLSGRKSTAQVRKAWINRALEENPVPTFWLSNSINGIDQAFIRRFDMIFELPVPPKKQRERILRESCGDILDADSVSRIAEVDTLAPAVIVKAASVVRTIRTELDQQCSTMAITRLINNTLEAQGHSPMAQHDPNRLPEIYDPCFIHSDTDLTYIADGLITARTGRLCLYGPPGTGKTAYGRWLAEQLGIPLLVKRASDLMSMWVGGSEENIARAFREATQDEALLLIDEVDSFLQDRRGAQRGWEVSLVNEMLTQIESFSGVFIASTNLMSGLDQAALRRFDLKVKFDFLRPEQASELFRRHCAKLNFPEPPPDLLARVVRIRQLTPGDFAAVLRQHRFRRFESASALVMALEAECMVKENGKASIGFI